MGFVVAVKQRIKALSVGDWIKLSLSLTLVVAFLTVVILCLVPDSPMLGWIFSLLNWFNTIPRIWACILMIEIYAILVPFGTPITPMNLVAGFLFGPYWGVLVGVSGAGKFFHMFILIAFKTDKLLSPCPVIGGTICYWWALTLLRDWAEQKLQSRRVFLALHLAVKNQAWKLIILTHISPILPASLLNYLFATMG